MNCIHIYGRCMHIWMLYGYYIPLAYSCDLHPLEDGYVHTHLLLLRGGYAD